MLKRLLLLWLWALACALPVQADEFRPAYLQLRQVGESDYEVLWKLPALDEATTLGLRPAFPEGTRETTAIRSQFAGGTAVQRWRIHAAAGLAGRQILFTGPSVGRTDVLVRVERSDGTVQLGRVLPTERRFLVTANTGAFDVVRTMPCWASNTS